jgi:hypothetical protein
MPYAQISNLDFNDIKVVLKEYMRTQTEFTDYDFEGSVLSNLLDVLAYNTYYTAFNTNMAINELFIDSATIRDNVVAIARQLGYRPRSIISSTAYVNFIVEYANATTDTELILKKGTGFVASFNNKVYQYVTPVDVKAQVVNDVATFTDVLVKEGTQITNEFTVNSSNKSQKFILDNRNIDASTIQVEVFSDGSTFSEPYLAADNILDVTSTSKVYFLNEIEDQRYELIFGDGVIGRKIEDQSVIVVRYIVTNGPEANGIRTFVFSGVLENPFGVSPLSFDTTITGTVAATGGEAIESIQSVKYSAPKTFGTQNRAVTTSDYAALIRNVYPSVSDIIVFGGEDQDPPQYGKVFISVKPKDSAYLTSFSKQTILDELKKYSVASVEAEIIDPSILYVELNSKIYYNQLVTDLTSAQISALVIGNFQSYIERSDTEKFNGKFRYSKAVAVIDETAKAINSNLTTVNMRKDFYPQLNSTFYYEICFQNAFDKDCDGPTLTSTGFRVTEYPNFDVYLEDRDGKIVLYRLDSITGEKVVLDREVGDIDYDKGELRMYDLTIIKGSFFDNRISVRVNPLSNDIRASREVYLDVDVANSTFIAYKE